MHKPRVDVEISSALSSNVKLIYFSSFRAMCLEGGSKTPQNFKIYAFFVQLRGHVHVTLCDAVAFKRYTSVSILVLP